MSLFTKYHLNPASNDTVDIFITFLSNNILLLLFLQCNAKVPPGRFSATTVGDFEVRITRTIRCISVHTHVCGSQHLTADLWWRIFPQPSQYFVDIYLNSLVIQSGKITVANRASDVANQSRTNMNEKKGTNHCCKSAVGCLSLFISLPFISIVCRMSTSVMNNRNSSISVFLISVPHPHHCKPVNAPTHKYRFYYSGIG